MKENEGQGKTVLLARNLNFCFKRKKCKMSKKRKGQKGFSYVVYIVSILSDRV